MMRITDSDKILESYLFMVIHRLYYICFDFTEHLAITPEISKHLFMLDCSVAVECPDYVGNRLPEVRLLFYFPPIPDLFVSTFIHDLSRVQVFPHGCQNSNTF